MFVPLKTNVRLYRAVFHATQDRHAYATSREILPDFRQLLNINQDAETVKFAQINEN